MQDWSDRIVDKRITDAMQSYAAVTPQQKCAAWDTLRARVEAQNMLPPLESVVVLPIPTVSRSRRMRRRLGAALLWTGSLFLDDSRYDRALRTRRAIHLAVFFEGPLRNLVGGMAT
jgi:hypothetical protein